MFKKYFNKSKKSKIDKNDIKFSLRENHIISKACEYAVFFGLGGLVLFAMTDKSSNVLLETFKLIFWETAFIGGGAYLGALQGTKEINKNPISWGFKELFFKK